MANQFLSNCSSDDTDLATINLVFSITGAVCFVISFLIVVLLLIKEAYHTVLQRLFLYLMVAIVLRELFMAASIEHQWEYDRRAQQHTCMLIGFIWNWTGILVFVFTVGIKVYLCYTVWHIARGTKFQGPKRRKVLLESSYVVLTVLLTIAYATIPFMTNNYGLAGGWCWITALDENCEISESGLLDQLFNGYIFYVSGSVIGLVLVIVVAVAYYRLPVTHSRDRLLLKKTFCVIITFVVNIVLMVFALMTRANAAIHGMYQTPGTWICFGITFPISLLLFPLAYILCFSVSSRKNRPNRIQIPSIQVATIPESDRLSPPSETYCSAVPYTNEFTHISTDAGYGSCNKDLNCS